MNPDEFEIQLQRLRPRPIPARWRDEILEAARRATDLQTAAPVARPESWWRGLLWPCPQAWLALAGVWVVIVLLDAASREPAPRALASKGAPDSAPQSLAALRERRRLLSEWMGPVEAVEPAPPREPRPRSELARSWAAA